ncbi:uncharacterized protein NFIA_036660 [Aspergillus fischeri NRRL 181]|uniref:Aminoglycoside phosphotransferase domain-containing protein n=1 Tax=Neosartorya fischeri (strain ATCC 1020 / DSM 3700 / CBS 544.65 / FGSC A1164 / JCM 1740 / NRRL 181 / WB 181) TaxID=331117 RepID=A1CZC4_NEOFI|nr:conserved hypothetical protein [Aspergillus fischeri NRRL 181]EAW24094.1 conserved hypothetical protein [Aspergillus fischeri NRRL 181]
MSNFVTLTPILRVAGHFNRTPLLITCRLAHSPSSPPFSPVQTISEHSDLQYEEFFRYSSGRWLWDEDIQLRNRYKRFNVSELKAAATRSVGAKACVSMTKIAEGGFNKVFRLVMDNNSTVIARIPYPNVGRSCKTTASEVATMDFARTILGIPVPEVLAWSGKAENPVGSEYILMEEATGRQLGEIWDDLKLADKLKIVEDIVAIEKKFLSLSFTRYGSLYFVNDAFPGCEKAEIASDAPQSQREEIESQFVIGPVPNNDFWDKGRASLEIDRGPWKCPEDYLKAIARREIAWISRYATAMTPKPRYDMFMVAECYSQNSADAHIELYNKFLDVSDYLLPNNKELNRSTIWHWDIHAPNLFVEGNKVTGLIDWQDNWAGPLFLQARRPKLVAYNGDIMLELPEYYKDIEDEDERARIRAQVEKSIVLWAYESNTKRTNSVLHEIFDLPHGRTRKETVVFSTNTWDDDIIPFRQCLIRVARHWDEMNNEVACPINFTDEELKIHYREGEGWNEQADFWDALRGFVERDGWTSNEDYERALETFAELRELGLRDLTGDERLHFEKQTRWAARNASE